MTKNMSNTSSNKQAIVVGVLSGALVVALGAIGFLLMARSEPSILDTSSATTSTDAAKAENSSPISPPSVSESMKELFGLKQGADEAKTAPDILSQAAFSQSFTLGKDRYFAQFFQSQQLLGTGELDESHAATVRLSVLTYKQSGGTWEVVDKKTDLTESGAWGQLLSAPVETLRLSAASMALLVEEGSIAQGYTDGGKTVLVFTNQRWHDTGVIHTNSSNGGACDPDYKPGAGDDFMKPCYEHTGSISVAHDAQGDFPDLLVTKQGTQAGENPDQIIPVKNVIVKYTKGKYVEHGLPRQP